MSGSVARVKAELERYEHPLFEFDARPYGDDGAVEIIIRFREKSLNLHTYYYQMHPRDIEHPQFSWTFQRQLYDCLHDYIIEMFTRNPQRTN
jgi:hypothetical protein